MVALTSMVDYENVDGVAVLTLDNPPVNALSQGVRQGLKEGFAKALEEDAVKAILVYCEGRTFIAGADITEFASGPAEPGLHSVLEDMDNASKPVIAAIHGTALGGGLETALCCHYRVAVASAKLGLPEVNLGLLPGGGGTQRLPRAVGAEQALRQHARNDCSGSGLGHRFPPNRQWAAVGGAPAGRSWRVPLEPRSLQPAVLPKRDISGRHAYIWSDREWGHRRHMGRP